MELLTRNLPDMNKYVQHNRHKGVWPDSRLFPGHIIGQLTLLPRFAKFMHHMHFDYFDAAPTPSKTSAKSKLEQTCAFLEGEYPVPH